MGRSDSTTPLLTGFAAVTGAAVFLTARFGPGSVLAGAAAGIGVAYLGFLLYYFLLPRPGSKGVTFLRGYLPGAVLRYVIMIAAFCAVVLLLKINGIGVLLGTFVGMMASTFISLASLRGNRRKNPEE